LFQTSYSEREREVSSETSDKIGTEREREKREREKREREMEGRRHRPNDQWQCSLSGAVERKFVRHVMEHNLVWH
jgi:hypothetical protein